MKLILTENPRAAKAVAKALGATPGKANGFFHRDDLTVVAVPADFLTPRKLTYGAMGRLPYIPETYNLRQAMSPSSRRFNSLVQASVNQSNEIIFASDGGADAQARFFNLCRHFHVGQKTSRMWLDELTHDRIRTSFKERTSGRSLHHVAQAGLVSMAMDVAFDYNFNGAMRRMGFQIPNLSRQEVVVLDLLRSIDEAIDEQFRTRPTYRLCINPGAGTALFSQKEWASKSEAENVLTTLNIPSMLHVAMTVGLDDELEEPLTAEILQTLAAERFALLPAQTMKAATLLFEQGFITSPFNPDSEKGIRTTKRVPSRLDNRSQKIYDLIEGREYMVAGFTPASKSGVFSVEIDGHCFYHTMSGNSVQNATLGTTVTAQPFVEAKVVERTPQSMLTYELGVTLRYLFSKGGNELGLALSSLITKDLVKKTDGMVFLSDKGEDIMDQIGRLYPADNILAHQDAANALAFGEGSGKQSVDDFGQWLERFTLQLIGGKSVSNGLEGIACPICGNHAMTRRDCSYRCVECNYRMPAEIMGRGINVANFRALMKFGYTGEIHGFTDEASNRLSSILVLDAGYQPRLVKERTHIIPLGEAV